MEPLFGSEDFRQYAYCPRKIYFRWVLRKSVYITPKMKKSQEKHSKEVEKQVKMQKKIENIDNNNEKQNKYDLSYRELFLKDENLHLCAKIDLMEVKSNIDGKMSVIVTEIKSGNFQYKVLKQIFYN